MNWPGNEVTTDLSLLRDHCCTITLCDVTLGDHEIKAENSTDLSAYLMDVKVLNSTAIKLKLSTKNPQDVTIEISQDNRVWSRQKPDKGGRIFPGYKTTISLAHLLSQYTKRYKSRRLKSKTGSLSNVSKKFSQIL